MLGNKNNKRFVQKRAALKIHRSQQERSKKWKVKIWMETLFHNLQKDHYGSYIKYSKFKSLVMSLGITEEFLNRLLDSLFEKKYIVAFNQSAQIYEDLNELDNFC